MTAPFPIDRLRLFATDGQLYRAFDHLIAARMGTLLLVPFHLVIGPEKVLRLVHPCGVRYAVVMP